MFGILLYTSRLVPMIVLLARFFPILAVCLLFFPLVGISQGPIQFKHISVHEGLSQASVNHILQDRQGFLWLCTQDGLNRYDGYEFKIYRNTPGDTTSLTSNFVWKTLESEKGDIWVATFGGGLCKLDRKGDQFTAYQPNVDDPLHSLAHSGVRILAEHPAGTLWAGTDYGLSILDMETDSIISFRPDQEGKNNFPDKNVLSLATLDDNRMLIGTNKGLLVYDNRTQGFSRLDFGISFGPIGALAILSVGNNRFWIGTGKGLFHLQLDDAYTKIENLNHFTHDPGQLGSIISNNVQSLFLDRNHRLWIATAGGLSSLDIRDQSIADDATFQNHTFDANEPSSLSHNQVNWVFGDEAGNIWAGTREGMDQFSIRPPLFHRFQYNSSGPGICANSVLGIEEDRAGNLWISTKEGLSEVVNWAHEDREFRCYKHEPNQNRSLSSDYVMNVYEDSKAQMWVCTRRGGFGKVLEHGPNSFSMQTYLNKGDPNLGPNSNVIYALTEDKAGRYWVGTSAGGMNRFDPETGQFVYYTHDPQDSTTLPHPYVYCFLEDSRGDFWMGTAGGGLCKMNRETDELTCYAYEARNPKSLSNDMILCLFESSGGQVWVGTSNGLCLLRADGQFDRFFEQDGLPNNVIYGIEEDDSGHIWVSTNNGIARIRYENDSLITRNFDMHDGLAGLEFSQFSYTKSKNGTLFFGGIGGITYFHPDSIRPQTHLPQIVITRFKLFNKDVPVKRGSNSGKDFTLEAAITQAEAIRLAYNQNFISFEFAGIEYSNSEKNQYAYKLEGLDPDWVYSGTRRFADYPNLPPGEYVFQVKASNGDGIWNEEPTQLRLSVAVPPWRSWWAYGIYALLAIGGIYGLIRYRTQAVRQELKTQARIEQAKVAEREQVRARSSRDFHDEAGNHLTKISLYAGLGKRKADQDDELHEFLEKIEENVKDLSSGMRDFIWVLDPRHDSLEATLTRIRDFGNSLFEHSGIDFIYRENVLETASPQLDLNTKRHLLLICKEAMNNALKYARCSTVNLSVETTRGKMKLVLADDGIGFDQEKLIRVNGLSNMRDRAAEIGGELTIHAVPGLGTTIVFEREYHPNG